MVESSEEQKSNKVYEEWSTDCFGANMDSENHESEKSFERCHWTNWLYSEGFIF